MSLEDKVDFLLNEKLIGCDFYVFKGEDKKEPALAKVISYSDETLDELKQVFPDVQTFYGNFNGLMIRLF